MSEALSTSPASAPRPEPTWVASIAPTALPSMPTSGPAIACASPPGKRVAHAPPTDCSATGSTSTLPHVDGADDPLGAAPGGGRLHAGGELGGLVEPVVGQPDGVGDRVLLLLRRRGVRAAGPRACGPCRWRRPSSAGRRRAASSPGSGRTARRGRASRPAARPAAEGAPRLPSPPPLKNCSKGVPLKGFWSPSSGVGSSRRRGCSLMPQRYGVAAAFAHEPYGRRCHGCSAVDVLRLVDIRDTPLDVAEVLAALDDAAPGGVTLFVGRVRDHDGGQGVTGLDVLRPPLRPRPAARGLRAGRREYDVTALAAVHRIGTLAIGDIAVIVATATGAPRRGVRGLPGADRHAQGRGADLEAPVLRRRHRGVGRLALGDLRRARLPRPARAGCLPSARGDPALARAARRRDGAGDGVGLRGWGARAAARSTATRPYAGWRKAMQKDHPGLRRPRPVARARPQHRHRRTPLGAAAR